MKKLAVLLFLCLLTVCLFGCGNQVKGETYDNADAYTAGNFTYAAADVETVIVHWHTGAVTLTQSTETTLSVSESGTELAADEQLHWYLQDKTLHIEFCASGKGGSFRPEDKALTVALPPQMDLIVTNDSGDITLDSHFYLSSLNLTTASGNITTAGLGVQADVLLTTASGAVNVTDDITARSTNVTTVSGKISLNKIYVAGRNKINTESGNILLQSPAMGMCDIVSKSGNVSLGLSTADNTVTVTTESGQVELTCTSDVGATITYNTESGHLLSNTETDVDKKGTTIYAGAYKKGNNTMTVTTTSGNFMIH